MSSSSVFWHPLLSPSSKQCPAEATSPEPVDGSHYTTVPLQYDGVGWSMKRVGEPVAASTPHMR